jgi:hypothetical protein
MLSTCINIESHLEEYPGLSIININLFIDKDMIINKEKNMQI